VVVGTFHESVEIPEDVSIIETVERAAVPYLGSRTSIRTAESGRLLASHVACLRDSENVYTPQYLWDELILHPVLLSVGSLSLSMLMSRLIFSVMDWRPVAITISSDILAIGMDHYFDYRPSLKLATETADNAVLGVFNCALFMLISSAVVLAVALLCSPPLTWAMVAILFGPAFIWDLDLLYIFRSLWPNNTWLSDGQKKLSVKRIPGIKGLLIGIIRGGGTFAVVYSVLTPLASASGAVAHSQMWTTKQIVIWSIVNRGCHSVMGDVRDYPEDREKQIPTLPVLFDSVLKTKILLTVLHVLVLVAYMSNPYIVFASIYAVVLVWVLGTETPRRLFHFSFQSQTVVGLVYLIVQLTESVHIK